MCPGEKTLCVNSQTDAVERKKKKADLIFRPINK